MRSDFNVKNPNGKKPHATTCKMNSLIKKNMMNGLKEINQREIATYTHKLPPNSLLTQNGIAKLIQDLAFGLFLSCRVI